MLTPMDLFDKIGKKNKFDQLYSAYYENLVGLAMSLVHNIETAENLVHDTYVKVIFNLDKIDDVESRRTKNFLMVILRNTCLSYLKDKKAAEDLADYEEHISTGSSDPIWDAYKYRAVMEKVRKFDETLSESDQILLDGMIKKYSYKELAQKLNISEKNVSVRISRLRAKIRTYLKEEVRDDL